MQNILQYTKKNGICGQETLFREMGYYILRTEQYQRSLKTFDKAIKYNPDDVRALIGRSRSRARACMYKGALDDINRALDEQPGNLIALADRALHTYLNCEFEDGLVQNIRLLRIRRKPDDFAFGVMHCYNAIDTSIGEPAGRPLRDQFKIIRQLAWKKNRKILDGTFEQKKKKRKVKRFFIEESLDTFKPLVVRKSKKIVDVNHAIKDSLHTRASENEFIPRFSRELPFYPLQNYTNNIEDFMAEKYLDNMYHDKKFLKTFESHPGASCPNQKGTEKIKYLAKTGYKMVAHKQETLRTRRPFYHVKYKEGTSTFTLKLRKAQELYMQQQTAKTGAELLLARLRGHLKEGKIKDLLNQAERLRKYCDSKPKLILPDKEFYLEEMFIIVRRGYYQLHRLNLDQYPWDQIKRIQVALGVPISTEPSTDSVIADSKPIIIDHKKYLSILHKRLEEQAHSTDEVCWCYYEMCRSSIEVKHYDIAKVYAKHCIQIARKANNLEWLFITSMLLVRIYVKQRDITDACLELNCCKTLAEELRNENLKKYVEKGFEVIEAIQTDSITGNEEILKREQEILTLMDSNLKDEFANLLRVMSLLPASRRMSVIPGFKAWDASSKSKMMSHKSTREENLPNDHQQSEQLFQMKLSDKRTESAKGVGFEPHTVPYR